MPTASPELVRQWVETGFNNQAIAGYGNSVEFLEKAVTTGVIPWNAPQPGMDLLDYEKDILAKHGGYLYFSFPFINNIEPHKPTLARKLRRVLEENYYDGSPSDLDRRIRNSFAHYAALNAINHYYESFAGKQHEDRHGHIVTLAYLLFPTLVNQFREDTILNGFLQTFADNADWKKPADLSLDSSKKSLPELREILGQAISRRGIIIYYNPQVLTKHVLPGVESETEMIIHSRKPLTLEVISGIEVLAEPDKKAIDHFIKTLESKNS